MILYLYLFMYSVVSHIIHIHAAVDNVWCGVIIIQQDTILIHVAIIGVMAIIVWHKEVIPSMRYNLMARLYTVTQGGLGKHVCSQ